MYTSVQESFSERKIPYTLFGLSFFAHLVVFLLLLSIYGPYSFFFSADGVLNGNDAQNYVTIAHNIAEGHGYSRFADAPFEPDAFRTPLLPLYFVPFVYFGGLQLIWLAMLVMNLFLAFAPLVLYKLARMFLLHGYAVVASLALALDPLFLYRTQLAEPDALFVFLLLVALYFCVVFWRTANPRYFFISSLVLGVSILAKPTALYVAAIIFIFQAIFAILFRQAQWQRQIKYLVVGIAIIVATLSPWLIRNHVLFGVWGLSSVGGFNLYEFYTVNEKMSDEQVSAAIEKSSREPSRYLPNQKYFTGVAMNRIRHAPSMYAKEQAVGTFRNLFVSELPVIYYYGHGEILPFPYNPESKINLHELLLRGDFVGAMSTAIRNVPKIAWSLVLLGLYCLAFLGWIVAWKKDRATFVSFTLFFVLFAYFVVASGPYVDAKYRMPAMPLIVIVALYGGMYLKEWWRNTLLFKVK